MTLIHFPNAVGHDPQTVRNLYVNSAHVDYVFSDAGSPNVTVIIIDGIWQKINLPLPKVVSMLQGH